jgi:hypothetical protein
MIRICENCGGQYATEHLEIFGGTPCKCGVKTRLIATPPDVTCSDWLDALRESHDRLTLLSTGCYLEHKSYPNGWNKLDDAFTNARRGLFGSGRSSIFG